MKPSHFLSCDWGTSSFRLRWVRMIDGVVDAELRGNDGVRAVYEAARAAGATAEPDRRAFFERAMLRELDLLTAGAVDRFRGAPLVISGMASSSIGWCELPYASLPFRLDGKDLAVSMLSWSAPAWLGETFLISGVSSATEVMRGEETELVGLMGKSTRFAPVDAEVLVLPGTHSKHLWIRNQAVERMTTFLTGELFEVLSKHSVLRATLPVEDGAPVLPPVLEWSVEEREGFTEGVRAARHPGLAASLFQVRTRGVLSRRSALSNACYLSGLLIGAEWSSVLGYSESGRLALGGGGRVAELYEGAWAELNTGGWELQRLPVPSCEFASCEGQRLFLCRHLAEERYVH